RALLGNRAGAVAAGAADAAEPTQRPRQPRPPARRRMRRQRVAELARDVEKSAVGEAGLPDGMARRRAPRIAGRAERTPETAREPRRHRRRRSTFGGARVAVGAAAVEGRLVVAPDAHWELLPRAVGKDPAARLRRPEHVPGERARRARRPRLDAPARATEEHRRPERQARHAPTARPRP